MHEWVMSNASMSEYSKVKNEYDVRENSIWMRVVMQNRCDISSSCERVSDITGLRAHLRSGGMESGTVYITIQETIGPYYTKVY